MTNTFSAGVMTISFTGDSYEIPGRGRAWTAMVTGCIAPRERLPAEIARAALTGLVVWLPDGTLGVIAGVETFLTAEIGVGKVIGDIGLLIRPLAEGES